MLLLDSAVPSEAEQASAWGWIDGATTNPILLGKSGLPPKETLQRLAAVIPGIVFYQLTAASEDDMLAEAERASVLLGEKAGFKIMPSLAGLAACARLSEDYPCAMTAVYSPAQAMAAEAAGAEYVIVYYRKLLEQAPDARERIDQILKTLAYGDCTPMAASIRSPEDAVSAAMNGFPALTVPFDVLRQLPESPLSSEAGANFAQNGVGV